MVLSTKNSYETQMIVSFGPLNRIAHYSFFWFVCLLQHGYRPYYTHRAIHHGKLFPSLFMYLKSIDSHSFIGL